MISKCYNHTIAAKGRVQAGVCSATVKAGLMQACKTEAFVTLCTLLTTPALLDAVSVLGTLGMQCHRRLLAPFRLPALQQRCVAGT